MAYLACLDCASSERHANERRAGCMRATPLLSLVTPSAILNFLHFFSAMQEPRE